VRYPGTSALIVYPPGGRRTGAGGVTEMNCSSTMIRASGWSTVTVTVPLYSLDVSGLAKVKTTVVVSGGKTAAFVSRGG